MSDPHFLLCRSKARRLARLCPRALKIQNRGIPELRNDVRDGRVEVKLSRFYELESCNLWKEGKCVSLGVNETKTCEYVQ